MQPQFGKNHSNDLTVDSIEEINLNENNLNCSKIEGDGRLACEHCSMQCLLNNSKSKKYKAYNEKNCRAGDYTNLPSKSFVETNCTQRSGRLYCRTERDVGLYYPNKKKSRGGWSCIASKFKVIGSDCQNWMSTECISSYCRKTFPIYNMLKTYSWKRDLVSDIVAGLSVGISAIPIGMSYALMGRFPPEYGLYCQLIFPILYFFMGTGRIVCVGANGVEAIMVAEALSNILGWQAPVQLWLDTAFIFSAIVGVVLILLHFFKLAFLANFLADSVISGFSTGCAILIAVSQLHYFLGTSAPSSTNALVKIMYIFQHIGEAQLTSIAFGSATVLQLVLLKYINKRYCKKHIQIPSSFVVVILSIGISYFLSPYFKIQTIPEIPAGLPSFRFYKSVEFPVLLEIAKHASIYAVCYFLMHIAISKSIARQYKFRVDTDQESFATGCCSVLGSLFQCFPVATSLARTSIAKTSNAKTQMYHVFNVLMILVVLLWLTPFVQHLPMAVLSGIVIMGVSTMMDLKECVRLLRLLNFDCLLWCVSCFTPVCFGAVQGVLYSVALEAIVLLRSSMLSRIEVLGQLPQTNIFRNIQLYPEAREIPGYKILRFYGPLNFSSANHFEQLVLCYSGVYADQAKSGRDSFIRKQNIDETDTDADPRKTYFKRNRLFSKTNYCLPCKRIGASTNTDQPKCFITQNKKSIQNKDKSYSEDESVTADAFGDDSNTDDDARRDGAPEKSSYKCYMKSLELGHMPKFQKECNTDSCCIDTQVLPALNANQEKADQLAKCSNMEVDSVNCMSGETTPALSGRSEKVLHLKEDMQRWNMLSLDCNRGSPRSVEEIDSAEMSMQPEEYQVVRQPSKETGKNVDRRPQRQNPCGVSSNSQEIEAVLIDASSLTFMDLTAQRTLKFVKEYLDSANIHLVFYNWKGTSCDIFYRIIPPEHCFLTLHDAIFWLKSLKVN